MSIPTSSEIPLALLNLLSDEENHTLKNTINQLGNKFSITEQEMSQQTISKRGVFRTRVAWSVSQLRAINALESVRWGTFRITSFGLSLLEKKTTKKNILKIIRDSQVTKIMKKNNNAKNNTNPNKQLSNSLNTIHNNLIKEIQYKIKKLNSKQFEKMMVKIIVGMGYGKDIEDAGKTIGGRGDGGIDGVIKEDEFGFKKIYLQAKKWKSSVGPAVIREFIGSMHVEKCTNGIIITTSSFTKSARDTAINVLDMNIELIDGVKLVEYMHSKDLGVKEHSTHIIKKIDHDFFEL